MGKIDAFFLGLSLGICLGGVLMYGYIFIVSQAFPWLH